MFFVIGLNAIFSVILFFLHRFLYKREPFSFGFVVLFTLTLRFVLSYIFFKIYIKDSLEIEINKVNYLVVTFSFLAIDVIISSVLLNKNNSKK